jgi:hypothetical protein
MIAEIRYFTSGISWAADYVAEAGRDEKTMSLAGAVRVTNRSGEDYENAQVRLVVGVVRLVEEIVTLARSLAADKKDAPTTQLLSEQPQLARQLRRSGGFGGLGLLADNVAPKEIVKENLSEYFIYTVEGRDTIADGWSRRLPSFKAEGVPVASYYKFEKERWGEVVMRYYRFTNSITSKLGTEPLPDGQVKAFRVVTDDRLYDFVGRTSVKYIPIKESVELELGRDPEVSVRPVLMDWQKTNVQFDNQGELRGWATKETWEVEVQNSREIPVTVDIRRNFSGDWTLATAGTYEKVDATKVKFVRTLPPRQKQRFSYEVTTRHGTNATR